MLCYIVHDMLCYITHAYVMLCYITHDCNVI